MLSGDLSPQMLEEIAKSMYFGSGPKQMQALELAYHLGDSANLDFERASQILSATTNSNSSASAQFIAASMLSTGVSNSWCMTDPETQARLRYQIYSMLFSNEKEYAPIVLEKLEEVISFIAFNDWPTNWPDFFQSLLSTLQSSPKFEAGIFRVLYSFLVFATTSPKVSIKQRETIISAAMQELNPIISFLYRGGTVQDAYQSILKFSTVYAAIIADMHPACDEFAQYIFYTFLIPRETPKQAFRVLLTIPSTSILNSLPQIITQPVPSDIYDFVCELCASLLSLEPQFSSLSASLEFTLSSPQPSGQFWNLWSKLLNLAPKNPEVYDFVLATLPLITNAFISLLPSQVPPSKAASSAILTLLSLSESQFLAFALSLQPSAALCIIMGIVTDKCPQLIEAKLNQTLFSDQSIAQFALYAISRNFLYLSSHEDLMNQFQMICVSLFSSEIERFSLNSLNYLASHLPCSLLPLAPLLLDFLDSDRLCRESFLSLVHLIAKVIVEERDNERKQQLCGRLVNFASINLKSSSAEQISFGAEVAWAITNVSTISCVPLMEGLWEPLFYAMRSVESAISVFPATVRNVPWNLCRKACKAFAKEMAEISGSDCALLDAFVSILQFHRQMENYRKYACGLVERMAQGDNIMNPPFFEFFRVCGVSENEEDLVCHAAVRAIESPNLKVSKASARLMASLIAERGASFGGNWRDEVVHAVVGAMLDQLHSTVFKSLAKLLFAFGKEIEIGVSIAGEISERVGDKWIVGAFCESIKGKEMEEFIGNLGDFLASIGKPINCSIRAILAEADEGNDLAGLQVSDEEEFK